MTAHLIADEPEWPMPGLSGPPSPRRLRLWRLDDAEATLVGVVTERGPGASVTNVAEHAYATIAAEHPGETLRLLEHYPAGSGGDEAEHFTEVTVTATGAPYWRPRTVPEVIALLGTGVLDDMPQLPDDPDEPPTPEPQPPLPSGPGVPDEWVFHGHGVPIGPIVVTIEDSAGEPVGLLPHYRRHADGFQAGYHGSGPAELARCLLIAVLGENARCASCRGSRHVIYDQSVDDLVPSDPTRHDTTETSICLRCDDGLHIPAYQQFKDEHVATWPQNSEWRITAGEIRTWLSVHLRDPDSWGLT